MAQRKIRGYSQRPNIIYHAVVSAFYRTDFHNNGFRIYGKNFFFNIVYYTYKVENVLGFLNHILFSSSKQRQRLKATCLFFKVVLKMIIYRFEGSDFSLEDEIVYFEMSSLF